MPPTQFRTIARTYIHIHIAHACTQHLHIEHHAQCATYVNETPAHIHTTSVWTFRLYCMWCFSFYARDSLSLPLLFVRVRLVIHRTRHCRTHIYVHTMYIYMTGIEHRSRSHTQPTQQHNTIEQTHTRMENVVLYPLARVCLAISATHILTHSVAHRRFNSTTTTDFSFSICSVLLR